MRTVVGETYRPAEQEYTRPLGQLLIYIRTLQLGCLCGKISLLRILSASLSGISMLNSYETIIRKPKTGLLGDGTSSIAMTTSTVSKLSRPRSFEKCDLFVILFVGHFKLRYQLLKYHTLDASLT